ncbi:hypothetical protein [Alicyclobacillus mengziensis]|uniref:DUF4367 domain-containing protein n=1 Tax=Alicyclobacillus mengziensis TaxID=2931921 RepID=A0A9X7W0H4_9BACL|nr:hypothetical protein [Alicyclobacillus mengziensis]QSO48441.1 hypothetical protein JZ786_05485 [Alicyclobacillus mengziensis]
MDYENIKEQLSSLNEVTLSNDAEERIRQNLQQEIVKHRGKRKRSLNLNRLGGAFASVAAVAILAVGYFSVTYMKGAGNSTGLFSGRSTTAQQPSANATTPQQNSYSNPSKAQNAPSSSSNAQNKPANSAVSSNKPSNSTSNSSVSQIAGATYTKAQKSQMLSVAQAVGVTGYVPTKLLPGDSFVLVKNGGKGTLIIDYHSMWLIETNQPQTPPKQNTNRAIQLGQTYITVQNMQTSEPSLDANVQAIMNSFVPVSQLSVK